MSYDLMVFEPSPNLEDREQFMQWYHVQTKWGEGHDYENPDNTTPLLKAWLHEMVQVYPAMNGPLSNPAADPNTATEYSIGRSMIYCGFRWSQAEIAYQTVFSFAEKHKVGFFDVSANNGAVWLPDSAGEYVCVHGGT